MKALQNLLELNVMLGLLVGSSDVTLSDWCGRGIGKVGDTYPTIPAPLISAPEWLSCYDRYAAVHAERLSHASWLPPYDKRIGATKQPGRAKGIPYYAQRLSVPIGARIFAFGDMHGDINALSSFLSCLQAEGAIDNQWKLTHAHDYLIFLGDMVDRGVYGLEILYTVMCLVAANPEQVWITRGNHEDIRLWYQYGFLKEVRKKYPESKIAGMVNRLEQFTKDLAVVLYLDSGSTVLQCCHGGVEIGYEHNGLLGVPIGETAIFQSITGLWRAQLVNVPLGLAGDSQGISSHRILVDHEDLKPESFGFLWGDFQFAQEAPTIPSGRGVPGVVLCGRDLAWWVMGIAEPKSRRIAAFVRGHQHNETMAPLLNGAAKGTVQLWDAGEVCTTIAMQLPCYIRNSETACAAVRITVRSDGWDFAKAYVSADGKKIVYDELKSVK